MTLMNHNFVLQAPVPRAILKIAVPASIGFFFHTLLNITNTAFAGHYSPQALAALGASFPLFFVVISFASGLSNGVTALMAKALGAGKNEKAKLYAAQMLTLGVGNALLLWFLFLCFGSSLIRLLGNEGTFFEHAMAYTGTIYACSISFIAVASANACLMAHGKSRPFRNFLIAGFFVNAALSPLFLYGWGPIPAFGVRGLAFAVVCCESLGAIYLSILAYHDGYLPLSSLKYYQPNLKMMREILAQGLPAALNMLTVALGVFLATYYAGKFGEEYVASYGLGVRIEQLFVLPCIGLNMAMTTIVGQSYGAQDFHRIRKTARTCSRFAIICCLPAALVYSSIPALVRLLSSDPLIIRTAVEYLHIGFLILPAYAVLWVFTSGMIGLGHASFAFYLGILRQAILPILVYPLLAASLGASGIWWGIFGINWLSCALAIGFFYMILRSREKEST
jgi:putative MATE family efflux protein